jgi:transposase
MARGLRTRGVTQVVMEASGVYTEPVYYALCEQDFTEVAVINPAHARALKGHKTDAKDCAWLAELFECGLLRGCLVTRPDHLTGLAGLLEVEAADAMAPLPPDRDPARACR